MQILAQLIVPLGTILQGQFTNGCGIAQYIV